MHRDIFPCSFLYIFSDFLFKSLYPVYVSGSSHSGAIIDILAQTARATVDPNNKRRKPSLNSVKRAFTKAVNAPVTDKDIFELAYPDGYIQRLDPTNDGVNLLDCSDCDNEMSSVSEENSQDMDSTPKKRRGHAFYCTCSKCGTEIGTDSKNKRYTNAASHARTCFGKQKLIEVCAHLIYSVVYSYLQVGDDTVTRSFLKKIEKHTPYRKDMKGCHADLQGKGALLQEGQDVLDVLAECVLVRDGAFEHCKLKDTAFKIGDIFDSGKSYCLLPQCCRTTK